MDGSVCCDERDRRLRCGRSAGVPQRSMARCVHLVGVCAVLYQHLDGRRKRTLRGEHQGGHACRVRCVDGARRAHGKHILNETGRGRCCTACVHEACGTLTIGLGQNDERRFGR
eukprot:2844924-Prymnesium_polylepis.1